MKLSEKKRILLRRIVAAGIMAAVIVLLAGFIVQRLIDRDRLRAKIVTVFSKSTAGTLAIDAVDLDLYPLPRIILDRIQMTVPGKFEGTAGRAAISLRVIPLLRGRIEIARVSIDNPAFTVTLGSEKESRPVSDDELPLVLQKIFLNSPDMAIDVSGGDILIAKDDGGSVPFRKLHLSMRFRNSADIVEIAFRKLKLAEPELTVAGVFRIDKRTRTFSIEAEGSGLDVTAVRSAADSLMREARAVRNIFNVLRAGTVRSINFQSRAGSLKELGKLANITIKGRLEQGDIYVPGWSLAFSRVTGDCVISGGILDGTALAAALGRSNLRDGALTVGLKKNEAAPLHLSAAVTSDLRDLLKVLKSSVKDRKLLDELDRFRSLTGEAEGKLVIGETMHAPAVSADISRIRLTASHQRFALPVDIMEGAGTFNSSGLSLKNLAGRLGKSAFSGVSGRLERGANPLIEISAGKMRVDAAEAFSLLSAYRRMKPVTGKLSSVTGAVSVSSLEFKGRAADSKNWQYRVTAQADNIEANLPMLPLPVRFGSGAILLTPAQLSVNDLEGSAGKTSFSGLTGTVQRGGTGRIEISSGKAVIETRELHSALLSWEQLKEPLGAIQAASGTLKLSSISFKGDPADQKSWQYKITGDADTLLIRAAVLPGPVRISAEQFTLLPGKLSFRGANMKALDAEAVVSGTITGSRSGIRSADLSFDGAAGPDILQWMKQKTQLPAGLKLNEQLAFSGSRLLWGDGRPAALRSRVKTRSGQAFTIDMEKDAAAIRINSFTVADDLSRARLAVFLRGDAASVDFSGRLNSGSIDRVISMPGLPAGSVSGGLKTDLVMSGNGKFNASGDLQGEKIAFDLKPGMPLFMDSLSLKAEGSRATVDAAGIRLFGSTFAVKGALHSGQDGLSTDLDVITDRLPWQELSKLAPTGREIGKKPQKTWPVTGTIRLRADSLSAGKYLFTPLEADITLSPDSSAVAVKKALVCGVSLPGTISRSEAGAIKAELAPAARELELQPTVRCLTDRESEISGLFDLDSRVHIESNGKGSPRILDGNISFQSKNGRIYRSTLLSRILQLLNVAEFLLRPKLFMPITIADLVLDGLPDLQQGFPYHSLTVRGDIRQDVFHVNEAVLDASSMKIYGKGTVDLTERKTDMKLIVAPVRTLDRILQLVPGFESTTLFSVPLSLTGDLKNPAVNYLPLKEVSDELVALMNRAFGKPVEFLEPVMSGGSRK